MFCVSSQWNQGSNSWYPKNFEQPRKKLLRKRRCWQGALLSFFSQLQARWDLWWCLVFPQLRWAIFINFDVHTTALFSPVKVHQRVRNFATKSQNRAKFRVLYGCAKKGTGLKKSIPLLVVAVATNVSYRCRNVDELFSLTNIPSDKGRRRWISWPRPSVLSTLLGRRKMNIWCLFVCL